MSFDVDRALDAVAAMQIAREAYGDAPEPAFAAEILRNGRATGLDLNFVHVLSDDGQMVWVLEIETERGTVQLRPPRDTTWRDYLTTDELALAFRLL